ncbi:GMC family oxidoreductase [Conexibacter sp. CPCC 206217]|uniref:GMC family oxidoreductase n=1 Tax=Conexibacter sp. CPCC 206217 TaxID=3064574 RepID=UPI0027208EE2|nr:GMC family oxidoreductase [Conexibacter sp. CPCC 206217]MDO8211165.1 GMC family oxidoreductase [Conexibacter sp. CPCC 206217]
MTDVVLVGLGGANGIAALELTQAGLDVVALEAGPERAASEMRSDEIRNDVREWLAAPKAHGEVPTWRSHADEPAGPSPWPMLMVNAVGGSTVHYPGLSARFAPWTFRGRSATEERYGADAIPSDSTLADWPLSYDELEPDYEWVEQTIGVAGQAGEGGRAFEGPRRSGYPLPPLRRSGWTELMDGAARELGWHPYPAPAAINSVPHEGRAACTYCGFCTSNGCHVNAKGSTDQNVIPRALATGRLRVETDARVTRIEVGPDGRASGVRWIRDGVERVLSARVVLVGTFTYENTRLLLKSASPAFPNGLANNAGQVGRHYIAHVTPFAYGLFPDKRLNLFSGLWAQATCVDDFDADHFDHAGEGFIGGGLCTASHELKPIGLARAPLPPGVPRWGSGWKQWFARNAQSIGVVGAQFDTLPYEHNVLDLDPNVRDAHGDPVVRVTFRPGENERRGAAFMLERLHAWLGAAGAEQTWTTPHLPIEPRHCYGGTRMGDDPATSVVDRHGFAHEVPNLGVLGASVFPTAGGHNPTLTVQALARRTARHLAANWSGRASADTDRVIG